MSERNVSMASAIRRVRLVSVFRLESADVFCFPLSNKLLFFSGTLRTAGLEVFVHLVIFGDVELLT